MKYLLIIFLSFECLANINWIPESKGTTVYMQQGYCEDVTGQQCFPFIAGVDDLEVMVVKEIGGLKFLVVDEALKALKDASVADLEANKLLQKQLIDEAKALVTANKGKVKNLSKGQLDDLVEKILILLGAIYGL